MQQITVNLKVLLQLIPFCSKDKNKYVLNGIRIIDEVIDKKFYRIYEATDGTKLARIYKNIDKIELEKEIILLSDDIKKIPKTKYTDVICDIDKSKHRVEILQTLVEDIDALYPNTQSILDYSITIPKQFVKNDKFYYIRGNNIDSIERFFNNGTKLNLKTKFVELNAIMSNQYIKDKTKMLGYFDTKNLKQVVVMPIG